MEKDKIRKHVTFSARAFSNLVWKNTGIENFATTLLTQTYLWNPLQLPNRIYFHFCSRLTGSKPYNTSTHLFPLKLQSDSLSNTNVNMDPFFLDVRGQGFLFCVWLEGDVRRIPSMQGHFLSRVKFTSEINFNFIFECIKINPEQFKIFFAANINFFF